MNQLLLKISGARHQNMQVTANGAPVRLRRNRFGNLEGKIQTDAEPVTLRFETTNELMGPLWLISSLFFFFISLFGLFDARRTYDKDGKMLRCSLRVSPGGEGNILRCTILPFSEGQNALSFEGLSCEEEENRYLIDASLRRKAKIILRIKIALWILLAAALIAGGIALIV